MGLDMPAALVILGVLGTICTGIVRWPWREKVNPKPNDKYVSTDVCIAIHRGIEGWMNRLESDIGEMKLDVKRLLEHAGK